MKLIKILTAFIALTSLQITAAQWLNVPPPAEARMLMMQGGVPVVGGLTCTGTTIQTEESTYGFDGINIGQYAISMYSGGVLYAGTTGTLCQIKLNLVLSTADAPAGSMTAYLYANASDKPTGSALSTCGPINASSLTTSMAEYTLACSDYTITNNTIYHLVFSSSITADPYIKVAIDLDCAEDYQNFSNDGGSVWQYNANNCFMHKIYIKE
jgi:hypothetical protein